MNVYKTDFCLNNYISKCDFINKYNSLSTQNLFKVSNICLKFNFDKDTDLYKKINAFVYLFSMFGAFPFLSINNTTKSDSLYFTLLFDTLDEINSFFFSFFIENWSLISMEDILVFEEKLNLTHNLYFLLSTRFLFGSTSNWISDLDSLNFKTTIKIETKSSYPANINLLKNFPLFWISG